MTISSDGNEAIAISPGPPNFKANFITLSTSASSDRFTPNTFNNVLFTAMSADGLVALTVSDDKIQSFHRTDYTSSPT